MKFNSISLFASFLLGGFLIASTTFAQDNTLSKKEIKSGWVLLFDGKTTSGWHNFKKDSVSSKWKVEDGALHLTGKGGGDICTNGKYADFILELDWKISEAGNSGIFYLGSEDTAYKAIWNTSPEYQVLDNQKHPDRKLLSHQASANYDLIAPPADYTKPVGQYNHTRIKIENGKVEHWLNGKKTVEYTLWSPEWEEMVKKSKFSKFPGYGRNKSGVISLQDHGDKVWFKNIKIKVLGK